MNNMYLRNRMNVTDNCVNITFGDDLNQNLEMIVDKFKQPLYTTSSNNFIMQKIN